VARRENTVDAFAEARRQGAAGVELDVRRSADRALVVHHDAELADGRVIVELSAADLPPDIPLLHTALDACAGMLVNIEIKNVEVDVDFDPDLFFPVGTTGVALDQIEQAKAVCRACDAQAPCLEFALSTNQESGVWGGTSEEERRKLRKQWVARQRRGGTTLTA
jgi:WhiB family redox-sensing transcriptional regulator